jgi:hypothetical protein
MTQERTTSGGNNAGSSAIGEGRVTVSLSHGRLIRKLRDVLGESIWSTG